MRIPRWPTAQIMCLVVVIVMAAFGPIPSFASRLPFQSLHTSQTKPNQLSAPISVGVSIGGKAGSEFSLLSVRREMLTGGNGERVLLSYGDRNGQPQSGEPGFFHVAVDHDSRRVVIDLAQITRTAVDPKRLAQILGASKLISSSDMTMDPQDGSTNITLTTKERVKVRVRPVSSTQAVLVIELVPVAGERL